MLLYEGDEAILDMSEAKKQAVRTTLSGATVICLQSELKSVIAEEQ